MLTQNECLRLKVHFSDKEAKRRHGHGSFTNNNEFYYYKYLRVTKDLPILPWQWMH